MIEQLPILSPDASRRDRTLARCHARLERRRAKSFIIERAVVAGACVMYLVAMAADVLSIYQ